MATDDQIVSYFQFYLQIMKKAAMEKEIGQNVSYAYQYRSVPIIEPPLRKTNIVVSE